MPTSYGIGTSLHLAVGSGTPDARPGARVGANTAAIVRDGARDLMTRVALDTPVDTGRARAGWLAVFDELG